MLVHETTTRDGRVHSLRLEAEGDGLLLVRDDGVRAQVPARVIVAVMRRYGRALDELPVDGEKLDLGAGMRLQRFRFRAAVDVEGRDYLALVEQGTEVIAALATTIAGALDHLLEISAR